MRPNRSLFLLFAGLAVTPSPGMTSTTADATAVDARPLAAASRVDADADHRSTGRDAPLALGERLFNQNCSMCHGSNGTGMQNLIPPLARSDFIAADPRRAVGVVVNGYRGRLTVNGNEYDATMPRLTQFSDAEFAAILSYVFSAWGNDAGAVSAADVARARQARGTSPSER